jgi:hypothetical protein
MPSEVSLADRGVLLLDALPEFRRHVLEVLRQPLSRRVSYEYHFAGVLDLNTFTEFTLRVMAVRDSSRGR